MKNKKDIDIEKDAAFLRADIAANEERIPFPDTLKEENITELLCGQKQKRNKKATVKKFVSVAVAACVALGIFGFADGMLYKPVELSPAPGEELAYASGYDDIIAIVKDYAKHKKTSDVVSYFGNIGSNKNFAVDAEISAAVAQDASNGSVYDAYGYTAATNETFGELYGSENVSASIAGKVPDFAETNLRVDGIGEADCVKTDGKYLYVLGGNNIIGIFLANADGSVTLTGTVDCFYDCAPTDGSDDYGVYVSEFYIYGDKLIVPLERWSYGTDDDYSYSMCSGVLIYNIADRTVPELIRTFMQDGNYVSSRVIGSEIVMISNYTIDTYAGKFTCDNVIPGVYDDAACCTKNLMEASDIAIMNVTEPDAYVVIGKMDIDELSRTPETLAFFGGGCEVYCTSETLYVYNTNYSYGGIGTFGVFADRFDGSSSDKTTTSIFAFDITDKKPVFKAQGKIDGYLLNNYSLDEYNGYLRVAATNNEENAVYVLNGSLDTVGSLGGIAPGEIIKSVRFSGNTAYVVTFVQTDPLFVIDLSDPALPVIKGEVKLPGFSSYLHPIGDGLMLGIGSGGTEDGVDGSAKISLFDVSDPEKPFEADSVVFSDAYLTTDYKAFVTVKADGSFIIPFTSYGICSYDNGEVAFGGFSDYTGAVRIAVADGKLVVLNKYLSENYYNRHCGNCHRVSYIGDKVYTVSNNPYIAAFDMATGEELFKKNFDEEFIELYQKHHNELFGPVDYAEGESATAAPAYVPGNITSEVTDAPEDIPIPATSAPQDIFDDAVFAVGTSETAE